ncbi:MAG: glycosyltransferase family 2 protein [Chitinophagaceae bacterium]|nr:glycosyltransferase family 2 protein [Chitinophagaceae bacterium]
MKHTIAIVILNYNTKKLLQTFIPSVVRFSPKNSIFVIDNGSTDDSVHFLKEHYPDIHIISLLENKGFAGGYNEGLQEIPAEYYILLNSDVEVTTDWTHFLLKIMQSDTNIAVCQPKILSYSDKRYFEYAGAAGGFIDILGYTFCRGRIFDTIEEDFHQYDDDAEIFWASGACFCIRASDFHSEKGFDEFFFAHMEEVDLCWRLKRKGKKILYTSKSVVYHLGGGTLGTMHEKKTYLNFRNNYCMLLKNEDALSLFCKLIVRIPLDWIAGIILAFKKNKKHFWAVMRAQKSLLKHFKMMRDKYKKTQYSPLLYNKSIIIEYYLLNRLFFKMRNR